MHKNVLFRGCTRPPMFLGVPYVPFFIGAGAVLLLAMYTSLDERSRCFMVKQGHGSSVCQLNLRGMDDALSVISASTDNIHILHQLLGESSRREGVPLDELKPEQWLDVFYEKRKGAGKDKAGSTCAG